MTREELIKKVALKMDEVSSSDDVRVPVTAGDNNPLYTQINNLLNESVNDVLAKAPIYRLYNHVGKVPSANSQRLLFGGARQAAVITVPDDFIRLVSISDNSFQRPIVDLAIEGDDVDKRQHNKYLVAKTAKPVAVLCSNKTAGGREILCYSYASGDSVKPTMLYIKRYDNDRETSAETDLDEYMIDIVSWVCAGRVFAVQGDVAKGKICDENASSLMI